MKIVINKESLIKVFAVALYAICGGDYINVKNTVTELLEKVKYTELPKGHGDLVDKNDLLIESYCIDDWMGNEINIVDVMTVKMANVIIEADKEEGEEE